MAHQALLRSSIFFIAVLFALSCKLDSEKALPTVKSINQNGANLTMQGGLVYLDDQPFTGRLYTLYPETNDTATIAAYLNGKEDGIWKKYYASKKIKELRAFKNGKKIGLYEAWWENGQQQLQYFFVDDEYQGTCKEWNERGQLSRLMNYNKGHEEGAQKWWYDDGKIKANYVIKDGRRYGLLGTKNCINVSDRIFKD